MATVNNVQTGSYYQNVRTQEQKDKLGKDDFLKILVTQLSHQDPLQPLQDREFIAQMTQFSTLEQITNLNTTFTDFTKSQQGLSAFASMIGKEVSWLDEQAQETQTGEVTGVTMKDSKMFYLIDNKEVPVEQAYSVRSREN